MRTNRHVEVFPTGIFERVHVYMTLSKVKRFMSLNMKIRRLWRNPFKWQPTPVFLPGESQGWGSLVGCHLWGRIESDTTEVT